jgi:L-2-hydroxyglutarate oxidase
VRSAGDELAADFLINCAGLQADRVARLCGVEPGIRIVPFRGDYYRLGPHGAPLVRHLIYPVPDPAFPFLGVHLTRGIDERVEAGPNAVLALKREGYRPGSFSGRDALDLFTYRGFWRLAARLWRTGAGELHRSQSRAAFVAALRRLVPEIEPAHLADRGAGVRAQAVDPAGRLLDDFRFVASERTLHVLNAPSPAATACLAIGASVAARVMDLPGAA